MDVEFGADHLQNLVGTRGGTAQSAAHTHNSGPGPFDSKFRVGGRGPVYLRRRYSQVPSNYLHGPVG